MAFHENYTRSIPTEALKVLGFVGDWEWDSYDTTEERNPHVWLDLSNSKKGISDKKEKAPIEKLRIERKPTNSIEFIAPKITTADILKRTLEFIDFSHTDEKQSVSGNISVQAIVDLSQNAPLYMRLNITYDNIRSGNKLATIVYSAQISPKVLHQQLNLYEDDSLSLNQDLFVCILEKILNNMYADIFMGHADFPYTRDMLYANNVRELLNDMQLIFMKEGQLFGNVQGGKIWHTGY